VRLGCTYVQVDAPQYAALLDPALREGYRQRGSDPDRLIDACIEMDNAALGRHPGVTFALHICRGNNQSMFYASGGYEPIARVFGRSRFQRFLLEYDDERSGGFEPLRFVPKGKLVVLGLVTTKRGQLENKDQLKRRIEEASRFVPIEQLCLSPQCGFSSTVEGNVLSYEEQVAKLRLIVETAREVWG
jgi:5-methyltetrahydropteroyltriglutamate--homocysteine methyltransferase